MINTEQTDRYYKNRLFLSLAAILAFCTIFTNTFYYFLFPHIQNYFIIIQSSTLLFLTGGLILIFSDISNRSFLELSLASIFILSLTYRIYAFGHLLSSPIGTYHPHIIITFILRLIECIFLITLFLPQLSSFWHSNKWRVFSLPVLSFIPLLIFPILPKNFVLFISGQNWVALYILWFVLHLTTLFFIYQTTQKNPEKNFNYHFLLFWILYTFVVPGSLTNSSPIEQLYSLAKMIKIFSALTYFIGLIILIRGIFKSTISLPRHKTELQLQTMDNTLNTFPVGMLNINENMKVTYANKYALELLGMPYEMVFDQPYSYLPSIVNSSDAITTTDLITKTPIINRISTYTNYKNESITVNVNAYYQDNNTLLLFSEASKEQDINDLKLQTRTIINASSNYIILIDNKKHKVMFNENAARLLNTSRFQFEIPYSEAYSALQRIVPDHINDFNKCINSLAATSFEMTINMPTKPQQKFIVDYAPIFNFKQELIGSIFTATDITALAEKHRKLAQKEKLAALGQMAAGIVHEIKNPLTSIKGFNQMIMMKHSDENKVLRYAETVENEINSMTQLVNDFLDYSKPHKPDFKPTLLEDLFKEIELSLQGLAVSYSTNLHLENNCPNKILKIDLNQIKQVIVNIAKNAMEAMENVAHPDLTISCQLLNNENMICLSIKDNGSGMNEQTIKKIGTPFFTTKSKGTGLGLSIAFQLIEEHSGHIEVESTVDVGTTFKIYLPTHNII